MGTENVGEEVLEGGEITQISSEAYKVDPIKKQKAITARALAYIIIAILALSVLGHYVTTAWLLVKGKTSVVDTLQRIFDSWLPVISGFAGAAVNLFFYQGEVI